MKKFWVVEWLNDEGEWVFVVDSQTDELAVFDSKKKVNSLMETTEGEDPARYRKICIKAGK